MNRKPLWRVSIVTTPEAEDAVAEMLSSHLRRQASSYFNLESGISTVTSYCESKPAPEVRRTIFSGITKIKRCGLKIASGKMTVAKVRREDWAESWKRHFKPIEIGDALLIKPSWSKRRPQKNQAVVVLDPGLSFGTGQHPTTAFCLHQIVSGACNRRNLRPQDMIAAKSFLDIGTGSGILAIAAAKLGYQPVLAFDFDLESVRVARANARVNRITKKLTIRRGNVSKLLPHPARKYDLICANLISDLLIAERRRIIARLNRGGTLVLAGILKTEFQKVRVAFEHLNLKLISSKAEKEWQSGSFRVL
jgi:ribosomal protein L11 methyltransferase